MIVIHSTLKGKVKLRIIQFYNHANSKNKQEILEVYQKLFSFIGKAKRLQYFIILIGDFNMDINNLLKTKKSGKSIPKWCSSIFQFLSRQHFHDISSMCFAQPVPTWHKSDSSDSSSR